MTFASACRQAAQHAAQSGGMCAARFNFAKNAVMIKRARTGYGHGENIFSRWPDPRHWLVLVDKNWMVLHHFLVTSRDSGKSHYDAGERGGSTPASRDETRGKHRVSHPVAGSDRLQQENRG
ncbi:hypothetical protein KCP78_23035 [Salmonella enterica subsp. enterica]|nr:hypothetical protein KCP78_23035 [Salmonella enterica subsp. enterica]